MPKLHQIVFHDFGKETKMGIMGKELCWYQNECVNVDLWFDISFDGRGRKPLLHLAIITSIVEKTFVWVTSNGWIGVQWFH